MKPKIENFDVDLPGPDFLTGLCVDKDDIEKEIKKGVRGIFSKFNKQLESQIISSVAKKSKLKTSIVRSFYKKNITLTISNLRYPVTKVNDLGFIKIITRAMVPKPVLGFPRKLI